MATLQCGENGGGSIVLGAQAELPDPEIGVPVEFKIKKKKRKPPRPVVFEDNYLLSDVVLGEGASCVVKECRLVKWCSKVSV